MMGSRRNFPLPRKNISPTGIFETNVFSPVYSYQKYIKHLDGRKGVFVITDSDHNSIKNIKGVYYLTLGNKNSSKLNKEYLDNLSYIEFNFDGKNTSFSFNKYYK